MNGTTSGTTGRTTDWAIDLSDGESFRAGFPHDVFRALRRDEPVAWHPPTPRTPDGEGFWVVSRWADVRTVQRDASTYSSDRGGVRERGGTGIRDERTAGHMLNQTDDPQHHRLRSLVNRGFTPSAVAGLTDEVRRRVDDLLDDVDRHLRAGEPVDIVTALARELPAAVICSVLGVPDDDRATLLDHLDAGIEGGDGAIIGRDATRFLRSYATDLIARKRREPDDAIMSAIVHARLDDGAQLSEEELVAFFALLFPAGAETTRSAIAGAVLAFGEHPEQFALLRAEPTLLPSAVDEVVRWTTPSVYKRRTASRDTELAGARIGRGDKVTIWEMSANRDERVFDDPFRFDVARQPNPHVGFGWGVHFCLGAGLARLELTLVLEALSTRYRAIELAGPASWTPNNRLHGLASLPVRLIGAH